MKLFRVSLILIVMTALTACGFQLRGSERPLNKAFPSVSLEGASRDNAFSNALKEVLGNARIELNDASINRLEILETKSQKRTASYSSRAKSAEFELIKTVTFRFMREEEELIAPMKLEARRTYLYRETAAVGKAEEENLLKQEMDRDLAQRIMLALLHTADVQAEKSNKEADAAP